MNKSLRQTFGRRMLHKSANLRYDKYTNRRFFDIGEKPYSRVWSVIKHDFERVRKNYLQAKYDYYKRGGRLTCALKKVYDIELIPVECTMIIIGGGLTGSACAYWIKQRYRDDDTKLIVIESDAELSRSTSLLSSGGVWHQHDSPEKVQMSLFTAEFLRNADEHLKILDNELPSIRFSPMGSLLLADCQERAERLEKNCKMQNEQGARVVLLNRDQLRSKFPFANFDDVLAGTLGTENEGVYDSWQLLSALREKNISLGVQYIKANVAGFEWEPQCDLMPLGNLPQDEVWKYYSLRRVVIEPQYTDAAPRPVYSTMFVNCAGAWSGEIAEMAGFGTGTEALSIPIPIVGRKRYVYLVHCPDGPSLDMPYLFDPSGVWCRREGIGNLYLCGKEPNEAEEEEALRTHDTLDVDYSFFDQRIWPTLARRIPAFEKLKVKNAWAYYADVNEYDGNAIIGRHPMFANYFHLAGFNGHSAQFGLPAARGIMEHILDGAYVSVDLRDFHIDRMLKGKRL